MRKAVADRDPDRYAERHVFAADHVELGRERRARRQIGVQALDERPVGPRVGRARQRLERQRHHADHAGDVEAAVARLEARQHLDAPDAEAGRLEGEAAVIVGRDRAVVMAQICRDALLGLRQCFGVRPAVGRERLEHFDAGRASAVDQRGRELGQAAGREIAGGAAAEAAERQPDAHLALGHAAAHAVAEPQHAGGCVELVDGGFARDVRIRIDRAEIVDALPRLVALAGLLDLDLQRCRVDRSGGQA